MDILGYNNYYVFVNGFNIFIVYYAGKMNNTIYNTTIGLSPLAVLISLTLLAIIVGIVVVYLMEKPPTNQR